MEHIIKIGKQIRFEIFYAGLTPDKYALIFIFNSESLIIMDLQLTIVISNI